MNSATLPPLPQAPLRPSLAELLERLGDIPPSRIWLHPPLGTATEKDLIEAVDRDGYLCELVDGVLVEKPMGWYESRAGHRPRRPTGSVRGSE